MVSINIRNKYYNIVGSHIAQPVLVMEVEGAEHPEAVATFDSFESRDLFEKALLEKCAPTFVDYDALYDEFNEFCGNHADCKKCYNLFDGEDASLCFKEFLKENHSRSVKPIHDNELGDLCAECHTLVNPVQKFCPECGSKLNRDAVMDECF